MAKLTKTKNQESIKLVCIGIVTGIVLLFIGILLYSININIWRLSFCTGFGIILASFGTSAKVKYKSATIAGGGAIAVILYLLITHYTPSAGITNVMLEGDFNLETQIVAEDREELLGAFCGKKMRYRFIIEKNKLFMSYLSVYINDDIIEIHRDFIEPYLNKGQVIEWVYDAHEKKINKKSGEPLIKDCANTNHERFFQQIPDLLVPNVCAEKFKRKNGHFKDNNNDYNKSFDNLTSNSIRMRINAKKKLVANGIEVMRPALAKLHRDQDDYRIKVGIVYVLSKILINNSSKVSSIRPIFLEKDIDLINKLTKDPDISVRNYASKILDSIRFRQ